MSRYAPVAITGVRTAERVRCALDRCKQGNADIEGLDRPAGHQELALSLDVTSVREMLPRPCEADSNLERER